MAIDHEQHPYIDISEAVDIARENIQSSLFSLETSSLPQTEYLLESVSKGIDEYNDSMEKALEKSKKKFQNLRKQLDLAERDWNKKLMKRKQTDFAKMKSIQTEIDAQLKKLQGMINACKTAPQETSILELFSLQNELFNATNFEPKEISLPPVMHFFASDFRLPVTEELLGIVTTGTTRKIHIERKEKENLRRRQLFTKSMLQKTEITILEDGYAERLERTDKNDIVAYSDKILTKYSKTFEFGKELLLDFDVFDMAYTSFQDIIVTDWERRRVMVVSRSGEVSTIMNTYTLIPGGICINDRGNVVVGLHADDGYGSPPIKLVVYTIDDFDVLHEIEHDTIGEPLFTKVILQVKQKHNGDYVVCDVNRVVCIGREGRFRWEYPVDFDDDVYSIACDEYDNIIVAQRFSNTISLLNCEGIFISNIMTEKDGVSDPRALVIDSHGYLWIGQEDEIKVVKYIKQEVS